MYENLKPLHDRHLVKLILDTHQGLILPGVAIEQPLLKAEVIRSGSSSATPLQAKPNDIILFARYGGVKLDEHYTLLRDNEILAVF
jgi:co-chaperonin GroES (HSP10)